MAHTPDAIRVTISRQDDPYTVFSDNGWERFTNQLVDMYANVEVDGDNVSLDIDVIREDDDEADEG